ncbi:hypothetical protein V1264_000411 [Littorina saxatilis]|uniref:Uncharacterized protein n=1 Tax=Littorina saxatilis TaxID=31220 RepID=A0AAN9BZB1_9CAEN
MTVLRKVEQDYCCADAMKTPLAVILTACLLLVINTVSQRGRTEGLDPKDAHEHRPKRQRSKWARRNVGGIGGLGKSLISRQKCRFWRLRC